MDGVERIAQERKRQIHKGYTATHDAEHDVNDLIRAAGSYIYASTRGQVDAVDTAWPWEPELWKPSKDPARNLEKAGALIAAAVDRLEGGNNYV